MLMYCTCQSIVKCKNRISKKTGKMTYYNSVDHRLFHPTTVDDEDICIHCGHYATTTPSNTIPVENKWAEYLVDVDGYALGDMYDENGSMYDNGTTKWFNN